MAWEGTREEHQPFPRPFHQHADVAVGEPLVGQVALAEHGRAQGPVLDRFAGGFTQELALHGLHAPGPLAHGAEQHAGL